MRFLDLILAMAVLAALVAIARKEFPSYDRRAFVPAPRVSSPSSPSATP